MPTDASSTETFKNRRTGLIVFGVFTILAGCVCALFVPLMLLAPKMAARAGNAATPPAATIMPAVIYAAFAIDFIWLGIGSVMTRRWARTLLAIQSWTVFITGILATVFVILMAPAFKESMKNAAPPNQPQLSESAQAAMLLVGAAVAAFFFVVLPFLWALFYSGRNVKATCEALDPQPRWTDRCPAPVLAASIWLAFGAVCMLGTMTYGVAPFFGTLLTGNSSRVFYIVHAVVWAYAAWGLYRLDRKGWWTIAIALVLFAVSSLLTYSRHSIMEMYSAMGYAQKDLATLRSFGNSGFATWSVLLWSIPALGYLLYLRRFFPASSAVEAPLPD